MTSRYYYFRHGNKSPYEIVKVLNIRELIINNFLRN